MWDCSLIFRCTEPIGNNLSAEPHWLLAITKDNMATELKKFKSEHPCSYYIKSLGSEYRHGAMIESRPTYLFGAESKIGYNIQSISIDLLIERLPHWSLHMRLSMKMVVITMQWLRFTSDGHCPLSFILVKDGTITNGIRIQSDYQSIILSSDEYHPTFQ
jgi:hypothetical protein